MLFLWLAVATAAAVLYFNKIYSKWKGQQINHRPTVPLMGNVARVALRREHMTTAVQKSYQAFPNDRLVGHYEFISPMLLVRDPELLKNVTVKDFDHFVDRRAIGDPIDPLFGRNLLSLKAEEWKAMRSSLNPAFTSSKIRLMIPLMLNVCDKMVERIKSDMEISNDGYIDVDVNDLSARFANDVIAACVFGLRVNSQIADNEFYKKVKVATNVNFKRFLRFMGFKFCPALMKKMKILIFPQEIGEFFSTIILGTMNQRKKHNIIKNDVINLLMELKHGNLSYDSNGDDDTTDGAEESATVFSDKDLVAQAVAFLFAGFETVLTTITFLLHELALNPHVQERLVKEIRENEEKNGGEFNYSSVQDMVYFDMVISELLRKWPPVPMIDRICVKQYNAGKPNSNATDDYIVQKGQNLAIPIFSFHRDKQYFPDPAKFDPERFSTENRDNIKPFTYMPFGLGPRNCIGSKFALCEVKLMVYHLLRLVEVCPSYKTCVPISLAPETLSMKVAGGHWLRFRMRKKNV